MISIPFYYGRGAQRSQLGPRPLPRHYELIEWVENNNGKVVRADRGVVGIIKSIDFENEEDATAFKLRFGI